MSKRILVIEDPGCCAGCPFLVDSVCDHCRVADDRAVDDIGEIPDWCPLQMMPNHKHERLTRYEDGWNDCLDAILGGNENG